MSPLRRRAAPSLATLLLFSLLQRAAPLTAPTALPHAAVAAMSAPRASRAPSRCQHVRMQRRGRGAWTPPPKKDVTPINDAIPFEEMRVLVDVGGGADELLGVMSKAEALDAADERELDLVLVASKAEPVVCKIVSYDKYRFALEKKKKEQQKAASRGKSELKELKLSYKIGDHDYQVRKKQGIKFLSSGDKVKFSMLFRGREVTHADVGRDIMMTLAGELEEYGVLDSTPKVMGRTMIMMISPRPKDKSATGKK